jgi:hypothetical protein
MRYWMILFVIGIFFITFNETRASTDSTSSKHSFRISCGVGYQYFWLLQQQQEYTRNGYTYHIGASYSSIRNSNLRFELNYLYLNVERIPYFVQPPRHIVMPCMSYDIHLTRQVVPIALNASWGLIFYDGWKGDFGGNVSLGLRVQLSNDIALTVRGLYIISLPLFLLQGLDYPLITFASLEYKLN